MITTNPARKDEPMSEDKAATPENDTTMRAEMWDATDPDSPHRYFIGEREVTAEEYAARPPLCPPATPTVDGSNYTRGGDA